VNADDELPPVLRDLGLRLKELRTARALTQAVLAEQVGVSLRYVQAVEGGRQNLKVLTLERFAVALAVPLAEVFTAPTTPAARPGRPRQSPG
jgi:transcriptional regulator with XRE-family HTH domain